MFDFYYRSLRSLLFCLYISISDSTKASSSSCLRYSFCKLSHSLYWGRLVISKLPPSLEKENEFYDYSCHSCLRVSLIIDDCWVALRFQPDLLDVSLQAVVQLVQAEVAREGGWSPCRGTVTRAITRAAGVACSLVAGGGGMLIMILV